MSGPERAACVIVLVLLVAPGALASHHNRPDFHILSAELRQAPGTMIGVVDLNDHFVVNMRVVNAGIDHDGYVTINEWWHINDLPLTVWYDVIYLDSGDTIDITADVWLDMPPQWLRMTYGPLWYCISVGSDWTARCWSLMIVPGFPQGLYPEDVPNWQLMDAQYGDGPQV